jgi:predicted lactoylglutathione lyase
MSIKIAVNLPVKNLAESTRFFAELGFRNEEQLANENTEAVVISSDIYVLLIAKSHFKTITKKEIPDAATTSEAIFQLQVDGRQRVDELVDKAFAAGARPANEPNDQGFFYGRSFRDLDGHNWDVFCIDTAVPDFGAAT